MTQSSSVASDSDPSDPYPRWVRDWFRIQPRHIWLTDLVVGLLVMLTLGLPITFLADWSYYFDWAVVVTWVPATLALVIRRTAPWPAFLIATLAFNLKLLMGLGPHGSDIALLIVLFSLAANGSRILMLVAGCAALVFPVIESIYLSFFPMPGPLIESIAGDGFYGADAFLLTTLTFALPLTLTSVLFWLGGVLQRVQITASTLGHFAELAEVEYQRTQEQLFVEQERNQIARDMHDVVAHSLAVVVAQADGGRYVMKSDPKKAEPVLETIADTAREALGDVRGLLAQLRHTQGIEPQKCLADIPAVVQRIRAAGLDVRYREIGEPQAIAASAEVAAFRVVQEALTNALKYSDQRVPTYLELRWEDQLRIEVRNRIAKEPQINAGSQNGLIGMRERLLVVGGDAIAGLDGCEWLVQARAPYLPSLEHETPIVETSAPPGDHEPGDYEPGHHEHISAENRA